MIEPVSGHRTLRLALAFAGGLLALIGASIVAAWAVDGTVLIQLHSGYAPTHYNAALALLLWGLGLLAVANRQPRTAVGFAVVLGAIGLGIVLVRSAEWNVGLETWAFDSRLVPVGPRGGMDTATAVAFLFGGVGLALMGLGRSGPAARIAIGLLGTSLLVGAGGTLFFPSGGSMGPPLFVTFGVLVGGATSIAYSTRGGPTGSSWATLPGFVAAVGLSLTFLLWHGLVGEQETRVRRQVQFEAAYVHRQINDGLATRLSALAEASNLALAEGGGEKAFRDRAGNYAGAQPGYVAVGRLSADGSIQWLASPFPMRDATKRLDELGAGSNLTVAIHERQTAAAKAPRSAWGGVRVLILYAPIRDSADGLLAVFNLQTVIDAYCNPNVAPGYAIELGAEGETHYQRLANVPAHRDFNQTLPVRFRGVEWRLNIWPTDAALSREQLSQPKIALVFGSLTSGLLALAIYLAQTARRRARALEAEIHFRTLTEAALRQSEVKYRSLIENLEDGIFLKDPNGRYLAANPTHCRRVRRAESELLGRTDDGLVDPATTVRWAEQEGQVLAEGRRIECEDERADGDTTRTVRRILTPVRDGAGTLVGVLGICWDVTDQRAIEAKLRQAGKMDALGQLAGGIAHDFNNLLTAIVGNLDLIAMNMPPGDRDRELVAAAQGAATRATSLTGRLLGFARQHQLDRQPMNLNATVDEEIALLRRTIDPRVRLEANSAPELWPVLADPGQMNQLLMNLCLNARDALAGPGQIRIETASVEVKDGPSADRNDCLAGSYVRLRVSDTGAGMPPEVRARIFEPFFTTKGVGKGTGLGLAMVFGIVKQHQGWVECRTAIGKGTTFDIYLPRTSAIVKSGTGSPTDRPSRAGCETILVADDEPTVRRLTAAVLRGQGYAVLEAEDGQQAVDVFTRELAKIDLVLLDLTMPVLSGQDAFRQMRRLSPGVRVMFSSGYAAEQVTDDERQEILGFVKKPFRPKELVEQIRDVLDRPRPASTLAAGDGRLNGAVHEKLA